MTEEHLTVRPFLRIEIMSKNKKNKKKRVDNKSALPYNNLMGGLYSQQNVIKRRYLSHVNTRQTSSGAKGFFAAGNIKNKPFLTMENRILRFFASAGSVILRFLIAAGKQVLKLLILTAISIYKILSFAAVKVYKFLKFAGVKLFRLLSFAGIKLFLLLLLAVIKILEFLSFAGVKIFKFLLFAGVKSYKFLSLAAVRLYKLLSLAAVKVSRVLGAAAVKLFKLILPRVIKICAVIKEVFSKFIYIVRYNPVVHRVMLAACTLVIVSAAGYLVYFAIASPELPPENMLSTIKDVSENNRMGDHPRTHVNLTHEDDWAELTTFSEADLETGAGSQAQDRTRDFEYPVRPGETLSEIAYAYGIDHHFLAWYNNISNADRIRVGTIIVIPSLENIEVKESQYQQRSRQQQRQPAVTAARAARNIEITFESHKNGTSRSGITAHFSIVNPPASLKSYEWDMGDGRRSFRQDPSYEYSEPKTYVVRLTAQDDAGIIYRSNPLYIDIPHPASTSEHSTTIFVTLSSPDEYFIVRNGTITKVARFSNIEDALDLSESDQYMTKVRFKRSGYYGVTVLEESGKEQYYSIFVSPIPTMHVDYATNNFNWYRTQFNTGTPSNCGPASASMAIGWGTGGYFPVSSVRHAIGWQGDGGTSFDDLMRVIRSQGVAASVQPLRTVQNIREVIDAGGIAIILFFTDGVRTATGDPASNLFGKYYNDSVGHYVVIKGYSLSGEYFVIHDPIPSDWGANSFRYGDELSMMGRNRYFMASEVLSSLRRNEMIVVYNQN